MKTINTLLLSLLIAGLTSCSKELSAPAPVKPQIVTYSVTCKACLVYFEDNQWNRNNHMPERPDNVSQHINVYGSWSTKFEVTDIDTASLRLYVSAFAPEQEVHARIVTNDGLEFDRVMMLGNELNDVVMDLPLRK